MCPQLLRRKILVDVAPQDGAYSSSLLASAQAPRWSRRGTCGLAPLLVFLCPVWTLPGCQLLQGCSGSVRLRFGGGTVLSGSGFRFRRFLCKKGFPVFQCSLTGKDGSGFGSWKTVPAVPVPLSVSGKTVPTVPVSGSSSVPEPPCYCAQGRQG